MSQRGDIRLALPSKGRLADDAMHFLAAAGLRVEKPNPRQLQAGIPALPALAVLFQRAGDIVASVRDGSVDFGITGFDVVAERGACGESRSLRGGVLDARTRILVLEERLGFGRCKLCVIAPEAWREVRVMADLRGRERSLGHQLRVATKFPQLTRSFFATHGWSELALVVPEGTLEVAPAIGYADLIVDLVSSGTTMRDNRLVALGDGTILESEACLIANRSALRRRPEALETARQLLELIEAHLRAAANVSVFANMRGESAERIAALMRSQQVIGGLQGPTIAQVAAREPSWWGVHIIVRRDRLPQAIRELRAIGGSGVVVAPVTYIFEEEPQACRAMLAALED
jgi:ATP phosphoribosyltransferase